MTETIMKKNLLSRMQFTMTPKILLGFRKAFLMVSSLLLVTGVVDLYLNHGFALSVAFDFSLSGLLYSFSNKCENLLLKLKIEKMITEQMMVVE